MMQVNQDTSTPKNRATRRHQARETIPLIGMSRWSQLSNFMPFCYNTFKTLGKQGKAPQPIKHGLRCVYYRNEEIHKFLADPLNYRVEG